jgi:hypothetical protein
MSDTKPPTPKADALAKHLKDSLAQRRPRPWKLVLAALFGSTLILVLLAWSLYPRPKMPPLQIIALDTIATPDETPVARAQLLVPPDESGPRRLGGHTIVFHEQRLVLKPNEKPREIVVKSDERGQASVDWPGLAEFLVLHIDAEQRRGSLHGRGRIFVWPKDAPLLIVDADETLIADELDAKASETLTKAAEDGWRVVYLALTSTQAHEFRKARGWLEKATLPPGPVLARRHFSDEETLPQVRRDALKQLKERFHGPMIAVVKTVESAQVCKETDLRTILIGGTEAPTWAEVSIKLK